MVTAVFLLRTCSEGGAPQAIMKFLRSHGRGRESRNPQTNGKRKGVTESRSPQTNGMRKGVTEPPRRPTNHGVLREVVWKSVWKSMWKSMRKSIEKEPLCYSLRLRSCIACLFRALCTKTLQSIYIFRLVASRPGPDLGASW